VATSSTSIPIHSLEPGECILKLAGADAKAFLQGQTTSDFQVAESGAHVYTAFCDAKGRVLADALAVVVDDTVVLLRGRQSVLAQLASHLKPYLAFSKSTLTRTDWGVYCSGPESGAENEPEGARLIEEDGELNTVVIRRGTTFSEYWHSAASKTRHDPKDVTPLARVDFETARARVEATTIGAYLPQDLNYDRNETVSFTKGCYTGQEIVARLHYRGTPKRRLHRALASGAAVGAQPGESITDADGRRVGSIINLLSLDEQLPMLIEVIPNTIGNPLFIGEKGPPLSSVEACHPTTDQSTG
jgi:folate-binding protein YgfZ